MKYVLLIFFFLCFLAGPLFAETESVSDTVDALKAEDTSDIEETSDSEETSESKNDLYELPLDTPTETTTTTTSSSFSASRSVSPSRPDSHAPIGVMGEHGHIEGEWMVSSRLKFSFNYMGMFMPGIMYGVTDRFTVMAMVPYMWRFSLGSQRYTAPQGQRDRWSKIRKDHRDFDDERGDGKRGKPSLGDISLTGLFSLSEKKSYNTLLTFGLLASPEELRGRDAYGVQGTFVFVNYWSRSSVGAQFGLKGFTTSRLEAEDMTGEGFVNLWGACKINSNISASARVKYAYHHNYENRGFPHRASAYLGGNFIGTDFAKDHRVALEVGSPIKRRLSPSVILGWQKAF
ncbi:MAG: hypothetical protein OXB86_03760 [Bdellovibrionales bacterium]|nr:hypothetical protein [Bdellovibrionales bacterium]